MSGCAAQNLPFKMNDFNDQDYRPLPTSGLTTSLTDEDDYYAKIKGEIPRELRGILYRNDQLKRHQKLELPRNVYLHDFFVSDQHIIINLPLVDMNILGFI